MPAQGQVRLTHVCKCVKIDTVYLHVALLDELFPPAGGARDPMCPTPSFQPVLRIFVMGDRARFVSSRYYDIKLVELLFMACFYGVAEEEGLNCSRRPAGRETRRVVRCNRAVIG